MGLVNAFLRTVRCSTFHIVIKEGVNGQIPLRISHQLLQCRMLMMTHCMKNEEKPSAPEKLDLDAWKNVLRSHAPKTESEEESEEESTIESMQKVVEMWRLAGRRVPDCISTEALQALLKLPTKTSRRKYLKLLWIKELKKANKQKRQLEKEQSRSETDRIEKQSSYILNFRKSSKDCFEAWRTAQALRFGQPLVFDMAYDRYMSQRDLENAVSQLMASEGLNRRATEPFHIHFCNLEPNGIYHRQLVNSYGASWDNLLITPSEKSYIDIFPKDQLVYLTADSPNVLQTFDHNKVYIIGAFVDRNQKTNVSLGIAKRLQLATARLPLDNFLKWDTGAKTLTLNQVIEILMTVKQTGDWHEALLSVPTRKHSGFWQRCKSQPVTLNNPMLNLLLKRKAQDNTGTRRN